MLVYEFGIFGAYEYVGIVKNILSGNIYKKKSMLTKRIHFQTSTLQ